MPLFFASYTHQQLNYNYNYNYNYDYCYNLHPPPTAHTPTMSTAGICINLTIYIYTNINMYINMTTPSASVNVRIFTIHPTPPPLCSSTPTLALNNHPTIGQDKLGKIGGKNAYPKLASKKSNQKEEDKKKHDMELGVTASFFCFRREREESCLDFCLSNGFV